MMRPARLTQRRQWLAAVLAGLLVFGGAAAPVATAQLRPPTLERFIRVVLSTDDLNLGDALPSGPLDSPATLEVRVEANFPHAGVIATLSPLEHEQASTQIPPERVLIRRADQADYVPLSGNVNLTGALPPGGFDYVYQFRVVGSWADAPGAYSGTLTLTYGVAP